MIASDLNIEDRVAVVIGGTSGIGVHYVDAYLKPMNTKLADGTPVKCKRRGLKIVLSAGAKKGEGLMRRLAKGPDPVVMLNAALEEASQAAGIQLSADTGQAVEVHPWIRGGVDAVRGALCVERRAHLADREQWATLQPRDHLSARPGRASRQA